MSDDRQKRSDESANDETELRRKPLTALEKAATTISALIVAALLGALVWDGVHPNQSPAFTVTTGTMRRTSNALELPVTVYNTGDDAAKSVVVHVELSGRDSAIAEADLTIDWLPGRSKHEVVAYFQRHGSDGGAPTGASAVVRGYTAP